MIDNDRHLVNSVAEINLIAVASAQVAMRESEN